MGRMVAAVILLLVTLMGWRIVESPFFKQNVSLPFFSRDVSTQQAAPQPRSTGFSSQVTPITDSVPIEQNTPMPPTPITPVSPQPGRPDKGQMW